MMIGGRKQLFYSDNLLVKIDPGLRAALAAAAERERTSMSELIRRAVRSAIAQNGSAIEARKQQRPC
jgi:predicted HicB family RNase H-like nuclease